MKISIQEIYEFASAHPSYKNFIGGKRILDVGQLIKCGIQQSDNTCYNVLPVINFIVYVDL